MAPIPDRGNEKGEIEQLRDDIEYLKDTGKISGEIFTRLFAILNEHTITLQEMRGLLEAQNTALNRQYDLLEELEKKRLSSGK